MANGASSAFFICLLTMKPEVATLLCLGGIGYLFWIDRGRGEGFSAAVWIPFFWMLFAGSRFASQWWNLGPPESISIEAYGEGSPFDRVVFLVLISAGLLVLFQRRLDLAGLVSQNPWLFLFFLFATASLVWSDDPSLSFKRLVKGVGNLIMALVLLTERRPYEALGAVLRRLAYVLVPLSVLFIRYYPELGRSYHMGIPMYTGVAFQKNTLGLLCMLIAMYFAWLLLLPRRTFAREAYRPHALTLCLLLPMLFYLLYVAKSATAYALTLSAVGLFLIARIPHFVRRPNQLLACVAVFGILYLALDYVFGLQENLIRMLGREPDLTDRRPLWDMLLAMVPNRWLGAGYETFWSGERMQQVWEGLGVAVVQAHNGYIDLYLSLGLIGVAILGAAIATGILQVQRSLTVEYAHAMLRLALILTALAYNYTEATIKTVNMVFVLLMFGVLDPPRLKELASSALLSRRQQRPMQPCDLTLTAAERERLVEWTCRQMSAPALALRSRIVLAAAQGHSNRAVALQLRTTEQTVRKWRNRFLTLRLNGLLDEASSGLLRRIGDAQLEAVIAKTLHKRPEGTTHWTSRLMAEASGLSQTAVVRIWHAFGLQPNRVETFRLSTDPLSIEKVRDIVGLYLNPPTRALALCVDENSWIRAPDRPRPVLPMAPELADRRMHDNPRHGTTTLFAALNTAAGEVIGELHRPQRSTDFMKFLRTIETNVPDQLDVHVVMDANGTQMTSAVRSWLTHHPRFHVHVLPTPASWLNHVERLFATLTEGQIRRGDRRSTVELERTIKAYLQKRNFDPRVFVWTKAADGIRASLRRSRSGTSH